MKLIILSAFVVACAAEFYVFPKDTHSPKLLKTDEAELRKRIDCFLDKRPCSEVVAAYKKVGVEAIKNACLKCSPEVKELARVLLEVMKEKYPAEYKEFLVKYDPTGTYIVTFEHGIGLKKKIDSPISLPPLHPKMKSD